MTRITLDRIENIVLNENFPVIQNCHSLTYLPDGIFQLAHTVRHAELQEVERGHQAQIGGFTHQLNFIACTFHWFAISLVNYLRMVALVDVLTRNGWRIYDLTTQGCKDTVRRHCREYVKDVIPDIAIWRNKVGAHFAATDPFNDDNLGTLQTSIAHPITYTRPYYRANDVRLVVDGQEPEIPSWAMTETYERLIPRYWPSRKLPPYPDDVWDTE